MHIPRHLLFASCLLVVGCPPPGDTADSGPGIEITDLSWALHDEIESLVYVRWTQPGTATARVEFRPEDQEEWFVTPSQELVAGEAEFLLLGIPYESDFLYRVAVDHGDGEVYLDEQSGTTGELPDGLPLPTVNVLDSELVEPTGTYLLSSVNVNIGGWVGGVYWKFIMDREGRVVWAHVTPDYLWTTFMRQSLDGTELLWDEFSFWAIWDSGMSSDVHRMKIDGTITHSYDTPGGHHAFTELPDKSIVWGSADWSTETLQKVDLEGNQTQIWNCGDFHDMLGVQRGCQSNTVTWEESTDTFLLSFYTTNTVVHVDHATGETLRWFGNELEGYGFDPETSAFEWQHGAYWLEENRLLLSTHRTDLSEDEEETVAREYVIDDETGVLQNVWTFGEGEGLHANTAGEAHRLDNGNTLHNYGSLGRLREVTTDGTIVWDVDWRSDVPDGSDRLLGRTTFIQDLYAFAP